MDSHTAPLRTESSTADITMSAGEFESLYRNHAGQLLAWLVARVPKSDIDDVHQDIWSRVLRCYATQFHGGNFRAWLFTIARNHLVDRARRHRKTQSLDDSPLHPADGRANDPAEIAADREHRLRLQACLDRLGQPRRGIVASRLAGEDYDSIAATLGITTPQAHSHFFAAKKLLRACLEAKGEVTG